MDRGLYGFGEQYLGDVGEYFSPLELVELPGVYCGLPPQTGEFGE